MIVFGRLYILQFAMLKDTDQWYIAQYLKYGSVEEVYKAHRWDIRIPVASYHRLVKRFGIVKSSGRREVSLSEMLYFFAHKALTPSVGIETLYSQMPPSFQTSLATLHRIYKSIVNKKPTRVATALFIHDRRNQKQILLGEENITARRFGRTRGDLSVPMCFAQDGESNAQSVLRVLQQEVLAPMAIQKTIPEFPDLIPFAYFDILDVRVALYELSLPSGVTLGSYKLANLHFENTSKIFAKERAIRTGVKQMIEAYQEFKLNPAYGPKAVISKINLSLLS